MKRKQIFVKAGYGIGAVGKDMVYMLSASYVLYYYQDLLGVSAWVMGVILLDLTNPEVVVYVKDALRNVLTGTGVDYVKWDMNRMFSDAYSGVLPADRQRETQHRWVMGLRNVMSTITAEFSQILPYS